MLIREDDLSGPEIATLLETHLTEAAKHSPPESTHALDTEALRVPEIKFWTAWEGSELMGCGALKEIAPGEGEIKSMHTAAAHRGKGVAAAIVDVILSEARRRNYGRLSLETGSMEAFAPAHALYRRFGFHECPPFGDYVPDAFSVFMSLDLSG